MSTLNKKPVATRVVTPAPKMGLSGNGNLQYVKSYKLMLVEIATSVLYGKDQFYNSADQLSTNAIKAINVLVSHNELDYVANTCLFARKVMDMRTYPIVIAVQFAKALRTYDKSYSLLRTLIRDVITRADELSELYAYALTVFGSKKAVPLAIKKGVADAFNKFDEYALGKYNSKNKAVTLKDLLRIVHPVPVDEVHSQLFSKIMTDTVATPYTWETEFSRNGQLHVREQKTKNQIWNELFNSGKLGYMALLRNLRNIETECDSTFIKRVAERIQNEDQVARSKQFPYAFLTALENVTNGVLRQALNIALMHSCSNIPNLGNKICIIFDKSGSMGSFESKSAMQSAGIFASAIIRSHQDSDTIHFCTFASSAHLNTDARPLNTFESVKAYVSNKNVGGSTQFNTALQSTRGQDYDAVFVLSDGDVNQTSLSQANNAWPKATKVIFNFNGSPTTPFKEGNSVFLTGLSGKIFQYLKFLKSINGIVDLIDTGYNQFPVV